MYVISSELFTKMFVYPQCSTIIRQRAACINKFMRLKCKRKCPPPNSRLTKELLVLWQGSFFITSVCFVFSVSSGLTPNLRQFLLLAKFEENFQCQNKIEEWELQKTARTLSYASRLFCVPISVIERNKLSNSSRPFIFVTVSVPFPVITSWPLRIFLSL